MEAKSSVQGKTHRMCTWAYKGHERLWTLLPQGWLFYFCRPLLLGKKKSTSFRKLWERPLSELWHAPLGKFKDRETARQHIHSECAFRMKHLAGIKILPSAKVFQWNPVSESKGLSSFRSQVTSISNTVAREAAQTPGRLALHTTQTNSSAFLSTQYH